MGQLFIYTSPFTSAFSGPFWDTLTTSLGHEHKPRSDKKIKTDLSGEPLIIVKSSQQKKWIYEWYFHRYPDRVIAPDIKTADQIMTSAHHVWETSGSDHLILEKVVRDHKKQIPEALYTYCQKEGVIRALLSLINEARKQKLNPDQYLYHSRHPFKESVMFILNAFKKEKLSYPVKDIVSTLNNDEKNGFLDLKKQVENRFLFILGFWNLLPFQEKAFSTLIEASHHCSWHLHYHDQHPIYDPTQNLMAWLKENPHHHIPYSQGLEKKELTEKDNEQLSLFGQKKATVSVTKSDTIDSEIRHCITDIVSHLEKDPTLSCDDIAIIYPKKNPYHTNLLELCQEYHLPIQHKEEKSLGNEPLLTWLFSLMELSIYPITTQQLIHVFHAPYSQHLLIKGQGRVTLSTSQINRFINEYKRSQTLSEWKNDIEKFLEQDDPDQRLEKKTFLAISELIDLIETFSEAPSFESVLEICDRLFILIGVPDVFDTLPYTEKIRQRHFIFALKEELQRFKHIAASLYTKNNLDQLYPQLKRYMKQATYTPIHSSKYGISVLNKSESYLINKKRVYILGLVSDYWPGIIQDNLFCSDHTKKPLGWPTQETYFTWDRFLFFSILYHCDEQVQISYPESLGKTPCTPSSLLHTLENFWGIHLDPLSPPTPTYYSQSQLKELFPKLFNKQAQEFTQLKLTHTPAEGHLQSPHSQERLQTMFKDRAFSATQLERYQQCPYYFFYDSILKERIEDDDEGVSPKIWGQLIHEIFYEFFVGVKEKHLSFSTPDHHPLLKDLIYKIAHRLFNERSSDNYFWNIKKIQLFGNDQKPGILNLFLEDEAENPLPLDPVELEHAFSLRMTEGDDYLDIKGKIDAVLGSKDHRYTAIMDYKTGKILASSADIKSYRNLQLILYQWAIEQLQPEKVCVGTLLYQLNNRYYFGKKVLSTTKEGKEEVFSLGKKRPFESNQDFIATFKQHLFGLKKQILSGAFHYESDAWLPHMSSKRNMTCQNCPYIFSCNYQKRFSMRVVT